MVMEELVHVALSPIDGQGLFASRTIKKETYLGTYDGPAAKRNGKYVLWVVDGDEVVGRRGMNKLRYVNHSEEPNAEFVGFDLFALRRIAPDEEITVDYTAGELEDEEDEAMESG